MKRSGAWGYQPLGFLDTLSEIKGAFCLFYGLARDTMGIDHGGLHVAVAKKLLDGPNVEIRLQEVGSKAVAKGVGSDPFSEISPAHGLVERTSHLISMPNTAAT